MAKIKNIEELRDHALDTIEKLRDGSIDTAEAGVTGKLVEGVISTLKTQMEYNRMTGEQETAIPFLKSHSTGKMIEGKVEQKALPGKK